MFENTNQEMVREIADETMKVHRLRNIMATIVFGADSDPDHRFVRDGDRNCSGNDQRKTDESGTGMQRRCDHGRSGSI